MVTNPAKVPERKVGSEDIDKFNVGLFLNGGLIAPRYSITKAKDVELDLNGYIVPRKKLTKFLPDTVNVSYQKFPVLWNGVIYYFTADNGQIKYCQETDSAWTPCGGSNSFTTNNGGMTKFVRVLDNVLILNGKNGDRLSYIDLSSGGFPIVKYTAIPDPPTAPSASLAHLSSGAFNIYYAFTYNGPIGETALSPILTQSIDHSRDEWSTLSPSAQITVTRTGSVPPGATYWNLYVAIAATSGTIQPTDMLLLATKLDISTTQFVDTGTAAINLGSVAPIANSTNGPKVDQGEVINGTPILYADMENPYAIWIGGGGPYAMDFSISNGGYKAEPEKGTNYYPSKVIGFRTGQGTPALTVLYSNTQGLSKQAVLEQQTVSYGGETFTVWGVTEQHYGAAGVAAPNSAINYNGSLKFLSTDGFMSMETQPSIQNVLSTKNISNQIDDLVRSIKTTAMDKVVGVGWGDRYMWLVPSYGFDTPQEILILDTNSPGQNGDGAWYSIKIDANWIGVISPADSPAVVYVSRGKQTYKLDTLSTTFDLINNVAVPFSTSAEGAIIPVSGSTHNSWMAVVQAVFYVTGLVGNFTAGVRYRNQSGKVKTKTKTYSGSVAAPSTAGGWGDMQWVYGGLPMIPGYSAFPYINETAANVTYVDKRIKVRVDDIASELQWFFSTEVGYNSYKLKSVSFEGIPLGVKPDVQ